MDFETQMMRDMAREMKAYLENDKSLRGREFDIATVAQPHDFLAQNERTDLVIYGNLDVPGAWDSVARRISPSRPGITPQEMKRKAYLANHDAHCEFISLKDKDLFFGKCMQGAILALAKDAVYRQLGIMPETHARF
jgi:hypothetical protein